MSKILILKRKVDAPPPYAGTKLVIMGLTPSKVVKEALDSGIKPRRAAFSGPMRKNLFIYFERLGINKYFGINEVNSIYEEDKFEKVVYTTSLLRHPVFKNGENYSGRGPKPWRSPELFALMQETFERITVIKKPCLIIPLGKIVSEAIRDWSTLDEQHFVLHEFPHPSGANGERNRLFKLHFDELKKGFNAYRRYMKR